ncbi:hypothetical protein K1W54_32405 [Micromonospora sp. CPCC 205371]|nr:hypothetical protein [Micromonospora sp. CPCC 205371]
MEYPPLPAELTRAIRDQLPVGAVVDGELIIWDNARGRASFAALQRRIAAVPPVVRMVRDHPAHYVIFDLLADPTGVLLTLPFTQRRARLERLLHGAPRRPRTAVSRRSLRPRCMTCRAACPAATRTTTRLSSARRSWTTSAGSAGSTPRTAPTRGSPTRCPSTRTATSPLRTVSCPRPSRRTRTRSRRASSTTTAPSAATTRARSTRPPRSRGPRRCRSSPSS